MERIPTTPIAKEAKRAFDLPEMIGRIENTVRNYPKAMLFELADRGYDSVFDQLVACLISVRTLDEVSLPASLRLLEKVRSPRDLSELSLQEIDQAIRPSTYHGQKAARLKSLAGLLMREYEGRVPRDYERLVELPGVGPKCANLTLGIACGRPSIGVDVHVHRVTNRWGLVNTTTPEKTTKALMELLPKRYWIQLNALLVPFGKHVCRGPQPRCSECPVLEFCRQVGVVNSASVQGESARSY